MRGVRLEPAVWSHKLRSQRCSQSWRAACALKVARLGRVIVGTQTINGKRIAIRRRKPFTISSR